jgi:hypothetical protein
MAEAAWAVGGIVLGCAMLGLLAAPEVFCGAVTIWPAMTLATMARTVIDATAGRPLSCRLATV